MVKNTTYHNRINQEENTPLVTILETSITTKKSVAIDSRRSRYVVDLAKASFGGITYPEPGSQWYLKKISGVWTLMARAPHQNPQLDPSITPSLGDTYIGNGGTTNFVGDITTGTINIPDPSDQLNIGESGSGAALSVRQLLATDSLLSSRVGSEVNSRFFIDSSGEMSWGPGNATQDILLYRRGVGDLATDTDISLTAGDLNIDAGDILMDDAAQINFGGSGSSANIASIETSTASDVFTTRVTGDTANRFLIEASGALFWGPGGSTSPDITLFRNAANHLKSDDHLTSLVPAARIRNNAVAQNISTSSTTKVQFDTTEEDISPTASSMVDLSNERIVIRLAGVYEVGMSFGLETNTTGLREAWCEANASGTRFCYMSSPCTTGGPTVISKTAIRRFAVSDQIELFAWQNSGGTRAVYNGFDSICLWVRFVSH